MNSACSTASFYEVCAASDIDIDINTDTDTDTDTSSRNNGNGNATIHSLLGMKGYCDFLYLKIGNKETTPDATEQQ